MPEFAEAIRETMKFMEAKILSFNRKLFGYKAEKFKKYEGEVPFREATPKNRTFDVSISDEPMEQLMVGSNTQDYNIFYEIIISYEYQELQKINAKHDFSKVRNAFINSDNTSLNQYDLHYFRVDENENLEIDTENQMMYLVVPVLARYTVTN